MTNFYTRLCEKNIFDECLIRSAFELASMLDADTLSRLFFGEKYTKITNNGALYFEDAFYPSDFFSLAAQDFSRLEVPLEKGFLCLYICLLKDAFADFEKRGICEDVFFKTVLRLSCEAKIFRDDNGFFGLYDYHFTANHVRGNILRLGEFEYQLGSLGDKGAVYMHVPDGARLDKRYESYSCAREFFGDLHIVLDSWLLYPEHKKMLPEDSSIVGLMEDFDIISTHKTYDYKELFHVFGRKDDYNADTLPSDTLLQKAYVDRIKNRLCVGSAVGILKNRHKC